MPDWTTPKTWETGEAVTASDMNTHIRDNVDHLHTRMENTDEYTLNEGSDYTTTSTSFVDVDATNLALTITTTKDNAVVLVHFDGTVSVSGGTGPRVHMDVTLDGTAIGGDDGLQTRRADAYAGPISFTRAVVVPTAQSHTFKLQWKILGGGTATLYAGAGTTYYDLHPQFWVKEL